ncbi:MAG: hypothetical protein WCO57_07035 [Verrucomicrobiota bacterium]
MQLGDIAIWRIAEPEFVGILNPKPANPKPANPKPANPNRHRAHQIQLPWAIMFHDLRDWMQVLQLTRDITTLLLSEEY